MPVSITPDFLVSTSNANQQFSPNITALADGRIVVTWESRDNGANYDIRGRILNADGTGAGNDFVISTSNANDQFSTSITALPDGRIAVTWASFDNGTDNNIRGRILNADGTGAGNDFVINTSNANGQLAPSITALADGRIAVTWQSFDNGVDYDIRGRILNADGTGAGNDFVISTTDANDQSAPSITALADGRIAVTWESDDNGTNYDIRGRILNADGAGAGNDFVISTSNTNGQSSPSITALADGRIAVTWESFDNGTDYDIRGRILNADGTGAGNDFLISTSNVSDQFNPSITALADGRIAVTWDSNDNGASYDIRGRILNADGTGAGNDFVISTTNASTQSRPGITALADGRIAVTWESRDNGTNYDIRTTIIDPKLFTGTTASDVWTGGSADDAMYGYGGDDVFTGGAGNDYLNGGDNTDTLDGNAGRDVLDGGTGNDILFGKADDDRLIGGRGADTLNGGKGADRFIYRAVEDGGDSVVKFQSGDRFVFDNAGFAGLKEGKLNSKAFKSGTNNQAGDANDRFIFRTGDDTLWYDADGKGGQASVLMADLTNNYDLKVGDILIV
jgi:Ca2+-binding RTX toxin-like protein